MFRCEIRRQQVRTSRSDDSDQFQPWINITKVKIFDLDRSVASYVSDKEEKRNCWISDEGGKANIPSLNESGICWLTFFKRRRKKNFHCGAFCKVENFLWYFRILRKLGSNCYRMQMDGEVLSAWFLVRFSDNIPVELSF